VDTAAIRRLNAINRDFYRVTAHEFDQTRSQAWLGWEYLLPYLARGIARHAATPLSVLDVGCGNGRFGVFLAKKIEDGELVQHIKPLQYHGIDSSPVLLERARHALDSVPDTTVYLEERDIIENPPAIGQYHLVALFGVLHHVPGYEQRLQFMRTLGQRVAPGGLLAFACWRFYEYERFRDRIVPWPDDLHVEKHDYLLDWRQGERALRYCHYVDDAEHAALISASGLTEIATYRADGQTGDANRYSILQRVGQ
jgi:SAM-dependent methyltransferase